VPRRLALSALILLVTSTAAAGQSLAVQPDSTQWDLQGQAKVADYQGRKCLLLDGGAATVNDFTMRDGVIDVDVATPAARGFFRIQFRITPDGQNAEWVYLRQHKSGQPDAIQYTPVLGTGPTGRSTTGLVLPARWTSRARYGFTCAWR